MRSVLFYIGGIRYQSDSLLGVVKEKQPEMEEVEGPRDES